MDDVALWVGTYPAGGPGGSPDTGEGVWRVVLDGRTGALTTSGSPVVRTASPSFVAAAPDGRTVYTAGEMPSGTVGAFVGAGDGLVAKAALPSDGDWPCHLLVHPDGRTLYVSNYESGTLAVVRLDDDGLPLDDEPAQVFPGSGSGPRTDRQEGPHAHSALLLDDVLLVADLGSDDLRRYRVADDGTLEADGVAYRFAPGTGPRHVAVGPRGHLYVVGELTATVHVLAWDAGSRTARELQVVPASTSPLVSGTNDYPAHVVLVGDHLLVSSRGPDVLARFAVLDDGARLEHRQDVPVGGAWPRHFAVVGDPDAPEGAWVVVAVQNSGLVTSVRWTRDGLAPTVTDQVEVPHAASVLPVR